jgi:hypothetical protein
VAELPKQQCYPCKQSILVACAKQSCTGGPALGGQGEGREGGGCWTVQTSIHREPYQVPAGFQVCIVPDKVLLAGMHTWHHSWMRIAGFVTAALRTMLTLKGTRCPMRHIHTGGWLCTGLSSILLQSMISMQVSSLYADKSGSLPMARSTLAHQSTI